MFWKIRQVDPAKRIRALVILAMIIAIEIAMAFTPNVGYIIIAPLALTTMLVPVTIVCVTFNWFYGVIAGLIFGLTSLVQSYLNPVGANIFFQNPLVSILPRAVVPIFIRAYYLFFKFCFRNAKNLKWNLLSCYLTGILGTVTHAVLVGIVLIGLHEGHFASSFGSSNVFYIFYALIVINMLIDSVVTPLISAPACYLLLRALSYNYFYNEYFQHQKQKNLILVEEEIKFNK